MSSEDVDLKRFEDAHGAMFDRALSEIQDGEKRSHWMWFVFPQVEGLGYSDIARRFAIRSRAEAVSYLDHPSLGSNYRAAVEAVAQHVVDGEVPIGRLLPSPDDLKLVSSLTLFTAVARLRRAPGNGDAPWLARAEAVLDTARRQGYDRCAVTEAFLESDGE